MKRLIPSLSIIVILAGAVFAQNSNSSTTKVKPRSANTTSTEPASKPTPTPKPTASPSATKPRTAPPATPGSEGVLAAFNKILEGIRRANVDEVTAPYWNSKQLIL